MRRSVADHRALIEQAGEGVIVLDNQAADPRCAIPPRPRFWASPSRVCSAVPFRISCNREDLSVLSPGGARAGRKISFDLTVKHADGSPRHLLATCTPRMSEEGRRGRNHRRAARRNQDPQADDQIRLLAHALHSTDSCVRISDMSDRIMYANPAFLHTYGYSESELLGQSITIVRSPRNAPGFERLIMASSHGTDGTANCGAEARTAGNFRRR